MSSHFKIFDPITTQELIRHAQHAEGNSFSILGEKLQFNFGNGILSMEFPRSNRGNRIWNITMKQDAGQDQALALVKTVDETYAHRGLQCNQWHFAGGIIPRALQQVLQERGFVVEDLRLWNLHTPLPRETRMDITIIPAQTNQEILSKLTITNGRCEGADPELCAQWAAAATRQLQDPHTQGFIALQGQTPVGAVYLLTFGETGFIWNMYVLPQHQGKKIATTLLAHVIETARRSPVKRVCLFCGSDSLAAINLYAKAGFIEVAPVPRIIRKTH